MSGLPPFIRPLLLLQARDNVRENGEGLQYNLISVASYRLEFSLSFRFSPGPFKLFEEINYISLKGKRK